ncbi:MAG TPA: hypothetical protein VFI13_09945, partial [Gemmatimonadales bacterium]|nr:hypothetical protein [Gemmatimonadales bacterium]
PWLQQRVLATVGGEIWAAYPMGYPIIEIRDGRTGAIQRVLYREAAWLPAIDPTIPLPDHRTPTIPDAQLIALLPRDSLVWVIWRAVSPKWRRGVSTSRSERGAEQWMVTKPDLAFDTYVEAYSQRTGALLAARQIDDQILLANAQGGFVRERTSPSEDDWLVSYQFTLSTSRR